MEEEEDDEVEEEDGRPIPRPGSALCVSLRRRYAHGHFTRAILSGNLPAKWPRAPPGTSFCASLRSRNAHGQSTRAYKSHFPWKFTGKTTGTPLGTSFCASLRSRNAHGHFTNALLDEGQFKASVVGTFRVEGNGSPDIQVVMLLPVAKSHFSLYKSFVVELKIFSGTTVLPVKSVVHGGPNIKLGLRVHDMSETNVNTLGLEKWFGEEVVSVEC